jgi:ADP-ribosylglycohydrolase
MKPEYLDRIYAGWLGKIIGIRLGAPVEGWTYRKIKNVYGELDHYPVDYRDFAADDDSNGPLFFLRALEDGRGKFDLKSQAVGDALLNYAPFEHGFFWWGGYGVSTEHTAYLNLRSGIPAPRSGSVEQNGSAVAEQIGGQIFIDTWGLVCPGNPDLAAKYAREAAGATHGGNGVYGGIFVASCIAYGFEEQDIRKIIEKGLSYLPADCEYVRVVRAVMDFHKKKPENWRDCFDYIFANFGYDRYPGNCHIIPNIAVMILGLLYGEGDFSRSITITNLCGWDTDCNVGNVGAIMGVVCGLEGIDYDKWRKPINDFLVCSSVMGSLNIMDIPYGALYIARLAWAIAGEELPEPYRELAENRIDSCHFEYPGSTHAIRVRAEEGRARLQTELLNTTATEWRITASTLPGPRRTFGPAFTGRFSSLPGSRGFGIWRTAWPTFPAPTLPRSIRATIHGRTIPLPLPSKPSPAMITMST